MEPPKGFLATLWNFICLLPYFIGLLLLGTIKGIIFCPLICLILTIGNSSVVLGLLPFHVYWTFYNIVSTKLLGPFLKLIICIFLPVLILWVVVCIVGSTIGGILYGFHSPIFATFDAVGEGKINAFFHCFYDGTWSTVEAASLLSGISKMFVYTPTPHIWKKCNREGGLQMENTMRSGREGPILETICVLFGGLAILLWPLSVVGAVLSSVISNIFLGAYAALIVYQESSFWFGLCYIIASLSIYDEYSNDVLDMDEGSCFASSFSKSESYEPRPPSRMDSLSNRRIDLKPLELLEGLFKECHREGEKLVSEALITPKDIVDAKSSKGSNVVSVGVPAYCLLLSLLRSAKTNTAGILLSDNTEITAKNRPKDTFFDWFLNPFLIPKEQTKAEYLTEEEEDCLGKLVLLCGDPERLKTSNIGSPPESEFKRAGLDALARRLQGITKSVSRYPTFRHHFVNLVNTLSEDMSEKNSGSSSSSNSTQLLRSKSALPGYLAINHSSGTQATTGLIKSQNQLLLGI